MPSRYPKTPYERGMASGVYLPKNDKAKTIPLRHNPPGNIILVHGVNDLGTSYSAVEEGLCKGLTERLDGDLRPASYRLPIESDKAKLEKDPDAVFYKRTVSDDTISPVIPFYWGFREENAHAKKGDQTSHGQCVDRYGNRLDLDFAKGGGPFANATSTLPDMWNRGKSGLFRALDIAQKDATHPVLNNPGRLYMVLAARRLAALVCMIRDYDEDEVVSIVAHSQGCLISLLAQAFLLSSEMKKIQANARPADNLIMTHPPYSLVDSLPQTARRADYYSGADARMSGQYDRIAGNQTLNARMSTLANIINGVWASRRTSPPFQAMSDPQKFFGAVGKKWRAEEDRDNRGKTYLYFCPEDMTVALSNVQGIGWQGVPDYIIGKRIKTQNFNGVEKRTLVQDIRQPMKELGAGFFQRVFTNKRRPDPKNGAPVLVGQPNSIFELRMPGENDLGHTAVSEGISSDYFVRAHLETPNRQGGQLPEMTRSIGRRTINGEPLKKPVPASLLENSKSDARGRPGAAEQLGPDDAVIAITSAYGIDNLWEAIADPNPNRTIYSEECSGSPQPNLHAGPVAYPTGLATEIKAWWNKDKATNAERCNVLSVAMCMQWEHGIPRPVFPRRLLLNRTETPNEARLRWQNQSASRSFHGAIIGGRLNHSQVTAYDVAIGGGQACADPKFYNYLCAVADWRLQTKDRPLERTLKWSKFESSFSDFFASEPAWRCELVKGSAEYYSTGILPTSLPLARNGIPEIIVCELDSDVTPEAPDPSIFSS